jgi:hypothetical protein
MIGPAEIQDMLADYEEAMARAGVEVSPVPRFWPVTQEPAAAAASNQVPYWDALERLRLASFAVSQFETGI